MLTLSVKPNLKVKEVECRTALNLSKISGMAYCLNPYIGCEHRCIYCYATFMRRFRNHSEEWGSFVDVKINFIDRLKKEIQKKKIGSVAVGTVSDPYQPIEAKYHTTRQTITLLNQYNFPYEILTKSNLIVRDIDLLKDNKNSSVELTITTVDEAIRQIFEPKAPSVLARLKTLEKLLANSIETTVFFGPVIPYFSDSPEKIGQFFRILQRIGIRRVLVDKLNYLETKIAQIIRVLRNTFPQAIPYYQKILLNPTHYQITLRQNIEVVAKDFKFSVEVLF
ncbi:MAG: radical SAM protein [candidate division WOR-3 bacterium]